MNERREPPEAHNESPRPHERRFTFSRTFTFGKPPASDDRNIQVISGPVRTFEWRLGQRPSGPAEEQDGLGRPPETYYEALSGRPDPHRKFFVSARKWLNRAVNVTALAFPIIGLAIGILSGAGLPTALLLGFAGAIIGLMFKTSFPKTPFD